MGGCSQSVTSHNSTYVHRHPFGVPRATRRCGAPLRHMALRPGWAQGHVTYVRFVMRNAISYRICKFLQKCRRLPPRGCLLGSAYPLRNSQDFSYLQASRASSLPSMILASLIRTRAFGCNAVSHRMTASTSTRATAIDCIDCAGLRYLCLRLVIIASRACASTGESTSHAAGSYATSSL